MVDIFTLALTHGLMAFAAWRLIQRDELDVEGEGQARSRWLKKRGSAPSPGEDG